MIRITIEMIPLGVEKNKYHLGTVEIANDGRGSSAKGNYFYNFFDKRKRQFRHGFYDGFPRKRLMVWDLLLRILKKEFGYRNDR